MKLNEAPVIIEQQFNAPLKVIWDAITKVEKMKLWFFENIPNFKPEVGFQTSFKVVSENRNFIHNWEITEVTILKKITYHWNYKHYDGDSLVHFELFTQENNTLLRVTTEIIEDFNDYIPEFKRESCVGGWNYFIKERLKNYIETSNK
jgi:uncharacterized protein YndB with AHSA1/START domain